MTRCTNQQNRTDHFCSVCRRQMQPGESYWRDDRADIVCDGCRDDLDRETVEPGDARYYRQPGAVDR